MWECLDQQAHEQQNKWNREHIISIALATDQQVNGLHNVLLSRDFQRKKDPGGGTMKSRESCFLSTLFHELLYFFSPVSSGWVVSIMQHYCGRLLRGNNFKDSKSLKGQRKTLMLYMLFECSQLLFFFVVLFFLHSVFQKKCCWEYLYNCHPAFKKKRNFLASPLLFFPFLIKRQASYVSVRGLF